VRIRIVAYYTNELYRQEAEKLRMSLGELGLDYRIYQEGTSQWTWDEAVRWKPSFCLRELRKAKRDGYEGILYVDVDAVFRKIPDWKVLALCDFGAHWFQRSKHHAVEILTGTLWFRACNNVEDLLIEWVRTTERVPKSSTPDQTGIALALRAKIDLVMRDIGPEWVYIFDDFKALYPGVRPVIEHFQASRRLRK
jgi:hypothetical protein